MPRATTLGGINVAVDAETSEFTSSMKQVFRQYERVSKQFKAGEKDFRGHNKTVNETKKTYDRFRKASRGIKNEFTQTVASVKTLRSAWGRLRTTVLQSETTWRKNQEQIRRIRVLTGEWRVATRRIVAGFTAFVASGLISIKLLTDFSSELFETALATNTTVDELQRLRNAMSADGVAPEEVTRALQRFDRFMLQAARGTKTARMALDDLGLTYQQLSRMSRVEQFRAIAGGFEGLSQSQVTQYSRQLFGRSTGFAAVLGQPGRFDANLESTAGITRVLQDAAQQLKDLIGQPLTDLVNHVRATVINVLGGHAEAFGRVINRMRTILGSTIEYVAANFDRLVTATNRLLIVLSTGGLLSLIVVIVQSMHALQASFLTMIGALGGSRAGAIGTIIKSVTVLAAGVIAFREAVAYVQGMLQQERIRPRLQEFQLTSAVSDTAQVRAIRDAERRQLRSEERRLRESESLLQTLRNNMSIGSRLGSYYVREALKVPGIDFLTTLGATSLDANRANFGKGPTGFIRDFFEFDAEKFLQQIVSPERIDLLLEEINVMKREIEDRKAILQFMDREVKSRETLDRAFRRDENVPEGFRPTISQILYGIFGAPARRIPIQWPQPYTADELRRLTGVPSVAQQLGTTTDVWGRTGPALRQVEGPVARVLRQDQEKQTALQMQLDYAYTLANEKLKFAVDNVYEFTDAITQFVVDAAFGIDELGKAVKSFLRSLAQSLQQVASDALGRSIIKNLLGIEGLPRRAAGGSIMANQAYIVGERRAEVFASPTSGYMYSSIAAAASAGVGAGRAINLSFNVNAVDARGVLGVLQQYTPELVRIMRVELGDPGLNEGSIAYGN